MMILSRRVRGGFGRDRRKAAQVVGVTAMIAVLWAGPAVSASVSGARASASVTGTATSSASGPNVKFYIVPPPANGHQEFLYQIATQVLGNGNLYPEIFSLNKGRLQPDGSRMETPTSIDSGWILQLPPNASGPGVHFGPLPVVRPSPGSQATAPAPHHRSQPVMPSAGASSFPSGPGKTSEEIVIAAIVIALIAITGLATGLSRRQKGNAILPRMPSDTGEPRVPQRPPAQTASFPVVPAVADIPPRMDDDVATSDLQWPDYLRSPEIPPPAAEAGAPAAPEPSVDHPVKPDGLAAAEFSPVALRLLGAQRSSAHRAKTACVAAQAHEVVLGDDRIQVVLAETPAARREDKSRGGHNWLVATRYLAWAPQPEDRPNGGIAFACLGAGENGCLFIDLAAAPGAVVIGGNKDAATRLAESLVQQLCTGPAASRAGVVVVGDAVPVPSSSGADLIASLGDLGSVRPASSDERTELVFCQLSSDDDAFLLARYVTGAGHRVIPVVLADIPDAPWSFTAQPSRRVRARRRLHRARRRQPRPLPGLRHSDCRRTGRRRLHHRPADQPRPVGQRRLLSSDRGRPDRQAHERGPGLARQRRDARTPGHCPGPAVLQPVRQRPRAAADCLSAGRREVWSPSVVPALGPEHLRRDDDGPAALLG